MHLTRKAITVFTIALLAISVPALGQADADDPTMSSGNIAPSAEEIRPLLLGAQVPSAMVADMDGDPVNLKEIVAGKPTVLIFYRGGW